MQDASRSESLGARLGRLVREARWTWGALNLEQRAAAAGAVLLIVSTFGPFSFVEAAIILLAVAVLALLRARAVGRVFHLPFGDGLVIASAGVWAGLLIVVRLFDRPLGQNLLALACAAILLLAGLRERAKRPPDDVATEPLGSPEHPSPTPPPPRPEPAVPGRPRSVAGRRVQSGEQLSLPDPLAPPRPLEPPAPPDSLRHRPPPPREDENA